MDHTWCKKVTLDCNDVNREVLITNTNGPFLDVRAPNSLIVAVLTAIPTMKTALTHYQYRYLEEQSDSE